jgi:photosystem II stability/assembly factor-like uncharacterized protein
MRFLLLLPCLLATALAATSTNLPGSSERDVATEAYVWRNVAVGGGGFVTGLVFHPTAPGVLYARTDVGGAYRWDAAAHAWQPLLDWLGRGEWNLQGVESLALDPADPHRVYLAVGTYTNPDAGFGAILRSSDQGRTWERTALPFRLGANEAGRGSGERMVVDPQDGRVLLLGTRRDGLWRSTDHGATWAPLAGFPSVPDDSILHPEPAHGFDYLSQAVGVTWVRFGPATAGAGEPARLIYAAVSRAAGGLYRSTDAGVTWASLAGQPTGLRPTGAAVAPDGVLYLTYGDEPGPNGMRAGAVWRYEPATARWSDITPERPAPLTADNGQFGYAGVCVDPQDPATVVVSTWNRWTGGDEIFRSNDRGATWHRLLANAQWVYAAAPYIQTLNPHWISDVEIDPNDRNHLLFTTGYGVWATAQAAASDRGERVRWTFDDRGLEETVPETFVSPPRGAPLISGMADVDGFRHDNLAVSPPSRFNGPRLKTTSWLDFAEEKPEVMVRTGLTYQMDRRHGAWSQDGGTTWHEFAAEPPRPDHGTGFSTGPVAVSADAAVIIWTTAGNVPHRSRDRGATWAPCAGAPIGLMPLADRVAANTFYGYDSAGGALYVSTDAGATFIKRRTDLPRVRASHPHHRLPVDFHAVPGRQGEIWFVAQSRMYHGTGGGRAWQELTEFSSVASLGLGRAPDGGGYPTLFVAASLGAEEGIFRSDDRGVSWVRISDDAHRFGSARSLTGDRQVFGRVYFATGGRGIVYGERAR